MRRWRFQVCVMAMLVFAAPASARAAECADLWDWVNTACRRLVDTYTQGSNELIVSGYAWHLPWTWTAERRAQENEYAWGGGWARTTERDNGDTDTVFFLVFSDSHRQPEFNLGYGWSTYWRARDSVQPGLGYTAMIIQRPDIASGIPVPVILPIFSLRYEKFTLLSTYIPTLNGGVNHGSILYVFGKIALD
ncbi:MAG TPA: hypothetical protein VF959_05915 [Casimicrobiaceae bacterium]